MTNMGQAVVIAMLGGVVLAIGMLGAWPVAIAIVGGLAFWWLALRPLGTRQMRHPVSRLVWGEARPTTRRAIATAALGALIVAFLTWVVVFSAQIVLGGPRVAGWPWGHYQLGVLEFVDRWGSIQWVEWGHIVSSVAFTYPLIFALVVGLPGEARPLTRRAIATAALGVLIAAFLMATVIFSAGIVIRGWDEWFGHYRLLVYQWGLIESRPWWLIDIADTRGLRWGESWWDIGYSLVFIYSSLFVYSFVFIALAVGSPLAARSLIRRLPGARRRTTLLTVLALVMLALVMLVLLICAAAFSDY